MRQQTLAAQSGFEKYGRKTRRERFLEEMEQIVPWAKLQALVEPHYPKGEKGRPVIGLSIMFPGEFERQEEALGCGSDAAAYGIVWIVEKKLRGYRDR